MLLCRPLSGLATSTLCCWLLLGFLELLGNLLVLIGVQDIRVVLGVLVIALCGQRLVVRILFLLFIRFRLLLLGLALLLALDHWRRQLVVDFGSGTSVGT